MVFISILNLGSGKSFRWMREKNMITNLLITLIILPTHTHTHTFFHFVFVVELSEIKK